MTDGSSSRTSDRSGERSPSSVVAAVAANLRRLREERGLSIGELARRAGVAKSTASQLEAGAGNPSIETLWALAVALEVPFGRLVETAAPAVRLVRAGEGPSVAADATAYRARLLSSSGRRAAHDLFVIDADPGPPRDAPAHLPGTIEHLVVLAGAMRAGPAGHEVELGPGDYLAFSADGPHRYETLAPGTAVVMVLEHA